MKDVFRYPFDILNCLLRLTILASVFLNGSHVIMKIHSFSGKVFVDGSVRKKNVQAANLLWHHLTKVAGDTVRPALGMNKRRYNVEGTPFFNIDLEYLAQNRVDMVHE